MTHCSSEKAQLPPCWMILSLGILDLSNYRNLISWGLWRRYQGSQCTKWLCHYPSEKAQLPPWGIILSFGVPDLSNYRYLISSGLWRRYNGSQCIHVTMSSVIFSVKISLCRTWWHGTSLCWAIGYDVWLWVWGKLVQCELYMDGCLWCWSCDEH